MNTVQILKDARALIADEKNWLQGAYAADETGDDAMLPNEAGACKFCSVGAVANVVGVTGGEAEYTKAVDMLNSVSDGEIVAFNDTRTHADVLSAFDRAIARAESEAVQ